MLIALPINQQIYTPDSWVRCPAHGSNELDTVLSEHLRNLDRKAKYVILFL